MGLPLPGFTVQYIHHPCLEREKELELTNLGVSEIAMVETRDSTLQPSSKRERERERERELKVRSQ